MTEQAIGPFQGGSQGTEAGSSLRLPAAAVVFDNDGVLVESTVSVEAAWTRWAIEHGLDPRDVLAVAHGHPSRETVARFVPEHQRAAALERIDRYELEDASGVTAIAGATELVAQVPTGRWAIVTSGNIALAGARLSAAGLPRPAIFVTSDDVRRGKPDPEGYALALARLGVEPARAIVLEDAPGGIAAARAAGAGHVVGVGQRALESGVPIVVRDLRALRWEAGLLVDSRGRLR